MDDPGIQTNDTDNDLGSHPEDNEQPDHHQDDHIIEEDNHHQLVERPKNCKLDMGTQYETPSDRWPPPEEYYETQITDIHFMKKKKKNKLPPTFDIYTQTETINAKSEDDKATKVETIDPEDQIYSIEENQKPIAQDDDDEFDKIYSQLEPVDDNMGKVPEENRIETVIIHEEPRRENGKTANIENSTKKLRALTNFRRKEYFKDDKTPLIEDKENEQKKIEEVVKKDVPETKLKKQNNRNIKRPPRKSRSQDRSTTTSNNSTAIIKTKSLQRNLNKVADDTRHEIHFIERRNIQQKQINSTTPRRINSNETTTSSTSVGSKATTTTTLKSFSSSSEPSNKKRNITTNKTRQQTKSQYRRHNSLPPLSKTKSINVNKWTTDKSLYNPYQEVKPRYTIQNRPPWRTWTQQTSYFIDPKYYF